MSFVCAQVGAVVKKTSSLEQLAAGCDHCGGSRCGRGVRRNCSRVKKGEAIVSPLSSRIAIPGCVGRRSVRRCTKPSEGRWSRGIGMVAVRRAISRSSSEPLIRKLSAKLEAENNDHGCSQVPTNSALGGDLCPSPALETTVARPPQNTRRTYSQKDSMSKYRHPWHPPWV